MKKLPKNYNIETESLSKIELTTRSDLNYVYLLLNKKIWVFKPNTNNYKNTQYLTYVWQIEWQDFDIIDFYINYDGEILVLNETGIHKLNFEISDDTLIIR